MSYAVTFEADYAQQRSRLSTFFRGILVIPLYLWLYLYGIVASFAILFAWFAIVITGRYPDGLFRFVAGYLRVQSLAGAYGTLLCDRYPAFGPEPVDGYPVRVHFDGPLERYSRAKTFFRTFLAIPIYVFRYALAFVLQVCAFAAWVVIVVTGRLPRGLFDVLAMMNGYVTRSDAYLFLLTETYPPFNVEPATQPRFA